MASSASKGRFQSLEYMNFIRHQPCIIGCKKRGSNHAHHTIRRKWKDGSDALVVSLCANHHEELHHGGLSQPEFFKSKKINLDRVIRRLHESFIREYNLVWDQTRYPTFEDLLTANNMATRYEESKKVNRKYDWQDSPKRFRSIHERPELWQ